MNSPTHKTFWVATAVGSCVLSATLTGLLAPQAQAGDPLPGGITLRASMKVFSGFDGEWLNTGFDNPVNPGNQVLKLPAFTWLEDLRPVVKIESEAGISGVAKPRLLVTGNSVSQQLLPSVDKSTSYNQNINYEWMELYAKWQVNENVTVSVGTQNIQWGPGELFSPSNEIFPFFLQKQHPAFLPARATAIPGVLDPQQRLEPDVAFGVR